MGIVDCIANRPKMDFWTQQLIILFGSSGANTVNNPNCFETVKRKQNKSKVGQKETSL